MRDLVLGVTIGDTFAMQLGRRPDKKSGDIQFSEQRFTAVPDRSDVARSVPMMIAQGFEELIPTDLRHRIGWLSMSMIGLTTGASLQSKGIAREGWSLGEGLEECDFTERLKDAVPELRPLIGDNIAKRKASLINDTTACAIGELRYGSGSNLNTASLNGKAFAYVYVGDGVNAGYVTDVTHRIWLGQLHPELGHIRVPGIAWSSLGSGREPGSVVPGSCRFHGDCLDGMLSRKAMTARWGEEPSELLWQSNEVALNSTAEAIAFLCSVVTMAMAPVQIAVGGYAAQPILLDRVRDFFRKIVNHYPTYEECDNVNSFVVPSQCGGLENMLGAIVYGAQRLDTGKLAPVTG